MNLSKISNEYIKQLANQKCTSTAIFQMIFTWRCFYLVLYYIFIISLFTFNLYWFLDVFHNIITKLLNIYYFLLSCRYYSFIKYFLALHIIDWCWFVHSIAFVNNFDFLLLFSVLLICKKNPLSSMPSNLSIIVISYFLD